jgi:hypothetical protein
MDVGGVKEIIEARTGLKREECHVGTLGHKGLQPGAECSVTTEKEVNTGIVFEGLCEGSEEFESLLDSHVAGVEQDDFFLEIKLGAVRIGRSAQLRVDGFDIDPVGEQDGTGSRNTFGDNALNHVVGDAGDSDKRPGKEPLEAKGEGVDGAIGGKKVEIEGSVNFEVLYVEPRGGPRCVSSEECDGGAEEGGFDGKDDLGLPEKLARNDWQAAEHEGSEVQDSLEAGGTGRDVKRGAVDDRLVRIFAVSVFSTVEGVAVIFADAPCGVVRGSSDDADFVASGG